MRTTKEVAVLTPLMTSVAPLPALRAIMLCTCIAGLARTDELEESFELPNLGASPLGPDPLAWLRPLCAISYLV